MTERREPEKLNARTSPRRQADSDSALLELGRQAGNKALSQLLGQQSAPTSRGSAGIRTRDSLRAGAVHAQREFAFGAQRDAKQPLKNPGRLLSVGTQGSDVAEVQQLLGLAADGVFGQQTHAAVLAFQRANGLAVDGIVGPLTWSALESAKGGGAPAEKIPASTDKVPESTEKIPESTDKVASSAATIPDTTDKIPDTTDKIPDTTDKIPDTTDKIPSSTDKIPESIDKLEGLQ